jgi:hypothetical protein
MNTQHYVLFGLVLTADVATVALGGGLIGQTGNCCAVTDGWTVCTNCNTITEQCVTVSDVYGNISGVKCVNNLD